MKEATGEVSGVVIVIVLLALVLGIGTWLFGDDGLGKKWITDLFNNQIGNESNNPVNAPSPNGAIDG